MENEAGRPRVQRWFFYTLCLSLLPFLISLFLFSAAGNFLRRPELPFFVIAVSAATVRDATAFPALSTERPWIIGSSVLFVFFGAILYILGRLPEIGISIPLASHWATLLVSIMAPIIAFSVQRTLADIERGS